ncbi:MAG: ribosome biogenesis GTP-binding protein YihA/YsxC [Flavobacteriales bacterium]
MRIKDVQFISSHVNIDKCPRAGLPEYAFIGRSNVGKSSLINCLMGRKSLAKTGARPGKTQTVNHFLVNGRWFLVDLPGYGYTAVSKTQRSRFRRITEGYISERSHLVCLFVLVDSRHELQRVDGKFLCWLGEREIPFALVFTKTDKLRQNELQKNTANYKRQMREHWETMPKFFFTSAVRKAGSGAILAYIDELNQSLRERIKPTD